MVTIERIWINYLLVQLYANEINEENIESKPIIPHGFYTILEQDERLTSSVAEEILKNQGKKYTKNKSLVDMTAACVILNEYLENNR